MDFNTALKESGYTEAECTTCKELFWKAPWFIPLGEYCDKCRPDAKEHFEDESREIEEEDINEDQAT